MRTWGSCVAVSLAAGLLAGAMGLRKARQRAQPVPFPVAYVGVVQPGMSPSAAARRSALACWARAETRANREREALEGWDPVAAERLNPEVWRRRLLAADPNGERRRARRLAGQAWVLARRPAERWSAACLEACLAYDAGDGPAQIRAARRLALLRPGDAAAVLAARRARAAMGRFGGLPIRRLERE